MYRILLIIILSLFLPTTVFSQEEPIEISINKEELKTMSLTALKLGHQRFIKFKGDKTDIGLGKANSILVKVPDFTGDSLYLDLRSFVVKDNVYYPIVIKLSDQMEFQELIQGDLDIQGVDVFGFSLDHKIGIDTTTKYLLVTTDPEMLSSTHVFEHEEANTGVMNTNGTMTPIYLGTSVIVEEFNFTDKPKVKILLPFKNRKPIYKRETGFYFGMGFYFGGEKVEEATEEQDFRAGGGGVFPIGYSHSIGASNFVARYSGSIRFQTGDEKDSWNFGLLADAVVTYQTRYINFGLGTQYDFSNAIKARGEHYKFKPVISPKMVVDVRLSGYMSVGLEYVYTNFKTSKNERFHGNRMGLVVRMFFGK